MFPVKLDKPLVIFDIEATGTNPRTDRIIELAAIRLNEDGSRDDGYWLLNPEMPIPPETIDIHHITDDIVKECPTFKEKALEIMGFFGDADLGGFNAARYDIPMLEEEFLRLDIRFDTSYRRILDAQRIYHAREPRNLSAALEFYCGRKHNEAHGAEADAQATLDVICGQFDKYGDLPKDMETLDRVFNPQDPANADRAGRLRWVDGEVVINFGKRKGEKIRELAEKEPSFLKWITRNDFPSDTREICENALKGIFPTPPADVKQ